MRKLILVKNAPPQIDPSVVPQRWVLSEDGRASCDWLAQALQREGVERLYASLEPKALETAALVGLAMGLPVQPRADLHENDRTGTGFLSQDDLEARMRRFFTAPGEPVVGMETADAARARFEAAIRAILAETKSGNVAIVTHGTVISLLTGAGDPATTYELWMSLGLPSYVVLDGGTLRRQGAIRNFEDES